MTWRRCPLTWLFGSYLLALGGLGIAQRVWPASDGFVSPFMLAAAFTAVLLLSLELHRSKAALTCPYAEIHWFFRALLYAASFLTTVVIAVAAQLGGTGSAIIFVIVAVALVIGLALHVRTDHGTDEFGAAPIWLVLLNWATVVLIVAGPVLIIIFISRRG